MNERNWGGKRSGAGRKKTGRNTVSVTITLSNDEALILKQRASQMGLTVSRFVAKFLALQ